MCFSCLASLSKPPERGYPEKTTHPCWWVKNAGTPLSPRFPLNWTNQRGGYQKQGIWVLTRTHILPVTLCPLKKMKENMSSSEIDFLCSQQGQITNHSFQQTFPCKYLLYRQMENHWVTHFRSSGWDSSISSEIDSLEKQKQHENILLSEDGSLPSCPQTRNPPKA